MPTKFKRKHSDISFPNDSCSKDTADMMILFSMSVTSDSESEVCMPDKNDVAGSNDTVSFLMAAMSSEGIGFSGR
jgi:hypothetical protein